MSDQLVFTQQGRLSGRPSTLIRNAMKDLTIIESDSRYRIDMGRWHKGETHRHKCAVCLAGSVMAARLGTDISHDISHHSQPKESQALRALDAFRSGKVEFAFRLLGIPAPSNLKEQMFIPEYRNNRDHFHGAMEFLAMELERCGY